MSFPQSIKWKRERNENYSLGKTCETCNIWFSQIRKHYRFYPSHEYLHENIPDIEQQQQEFHSELFSFMDLSALSDIEKNELLKILHKHGVEVPLDQDDNVQHQQHQEDLPAGEVDPVDNFIGKVK